ncbi:hypothetical protein CEXT_134101 [Caerostris extrusa]|uniref:LAGLIDADG homing endonuclease n=1 Tax=Caerostris extrusa TaxID=172846 RepID=A0AAV4NAG5_CAEEX|nr:hypothetical protein CEXT_134101 [Caerostris extrusa]
MDTKHTPPRAKRKRKIFSFVKGIQKQLPNNSARIHPQLTTSEADSGIFRKFLKLHPQSRLEEIKRDGGKIKGNSRYIWKLKGHNHNVTRNLSIKLGGGNRCLGPRPMRNIFDILIY